MQSKEKKKDKEKRLGEAYQSATCNLCKCKSFVMEEFLTGEEECYLFKCSNKKCKNKFVLDYNSYVYNTYEHSQ